MAKELYVTARGDKGYLPLRSDSHGWVDLAKIPDGTEVWKLIDIPPEDGHCQVAYYEGAVWPKSPTGEYWLLEDHLDKVDVAPPPGPADGKKYHIEFPGGVDITVV